MMSEEKSRLDVNDVFEDLIQEIQRQNIELIFANRLLRVLLEIKYNLVYKLKHPDNSEYTVLFKSDMTKFINLDKLFNLICDEKKVMVNEEVVVSVEQNNAEKVDKQTSTDLFDLAEEVEPRQVDQLIETINEIIGQMEEEIEENDIELQTDSRKVQQPIDSRDEQVGEQQDYQMNNEYNEQEDEQLSDEKEEQIARVEGHIENHQTHIAEQTTQNNLHHNPNDPGDQQDQLVEQMVICPIGQDDHTASVQVVSSSQVSNSNQILVKKNKLITTYDKCNDGKLIKKVFLLNELANCNNVDFPANKDCGINLSNDPNNGNERPEHRANNDVNKVINEVGVQTDNECERDVRFTPQSDDSDETDNESIILENSVDSDSESETLTSDDDRSIDEQQLDMDQSSASHSRKAQQEVEGELTAYRPINGVLEKCVTKQIKRRHRIRHKKIREYDLRESPRSNPINYWEQMYIGNKNRRNKYDKIDYWSMTTSKSRVLNAATTEAYDNMDRMKTKIKLFVCDINGCGKVLKTKHGLILHRKRHANNSEEDDQQLFKCQYIFCHKIFATKDAVDRHQQKYHQQHKIMYKCHFENCGKEFDNRIGLTKHFAIHTPIKELEVKANKVQQNLHRVLSKQNNDRPFQCPVASCPLAFSRKAAVKRHLNTHSNRFKCMVDDCEYRADGKWRLERHQLDRHNIKVVCKE